MSKRAFRAAIAGERLPNYPSLNEFRLSGRALVAGIGAALITSSCAPFLSAMGEDPDAGELVPSLGGAPNLPDGGLPKPSGQPAEDLPDAGE